MSDRCIVCGSRCDELHRHPQGAKQDIPFCSDCIQSLALQWFADNLSVTISKFYDKHGNERPLVIPRKDEK